REHRVLSDAPLRQALRRKGLENVQRFSWDISAQSAFSQRIDALLEPAEQGKHHAAPESSPGKP
ncbi:glycosyltransferase family 4 protein, partial [Pseudomonas syringae pv. actinidiae]|nr:glycosyltransferase family 4 protein [Pseudomonas syringae pv. actinidiae]